MMLNPFQRFLGVDDDSDPIAMLGLAPESAREPLQIEAALQRQLTRIFSHPDGRSPEAEDVRHSLRAAAEQLKKQVLPAPTPAATGIRPAAGHPAWMEQAVRRRHVARQNAPRIMFNLTAFDRMVFAVLVACGGWNKMSRARLVALASAYDVSAEGLLRVVSGLSAYARAGGPRLGVGDMVAPAPPPRAMQLGALAQSPPSGTPLGPALLDRLTASLAAELRRDDPWPTIKLAAIFGVVTIIVGVIALRAIFSSKPADHPLAPAPAPAVAASTGPSGTARPSAAAPTPREPELRRARFAKEPGFLANSTPIEAVSARDDAATLPAELDLLARKLTVADSEPAEIVYREWDRAIETIGSAWVITDASTRGEIEHAMFEALRAAADTPAVSDRLLRALTPPATTTKPLDVWGGAWQAGMLGRISSGSSGLPPVVVERARSLLEIALSRNVQADITFDAAADAYLMLVMPQLVTALEFETRTFDYWELWLAAERALGKGDRHDRAVAAAMGEILATGTDLARPGPSLDVLARLLEIALASSSPLIRHEIESFFESERITARDLWILTSLLAISDASSWFTDSLVLPEEADARHRGRIRDEIARLWPAPAVTGQEQRPAAGLKVDSNGGARWLRIFDQLTATPLARDSEGLTHQLIVTARLIEAAHALIAAKPETALPIMDGIESGLDVAGSGGAGARLPLLAPRAGGGGTGVGQPIGQDGAWTQAHEQFSRNTDERLESLRALQANGGTDLGPSDARTFVREVYRGSPQEVRALAQTMLAEFQNGPNVALEMVNQFADAPMNEALSTAIQGFTGAILPGSRSAAWAIDARLALVNHAISLRSEESAEIDLLTEAIIDSYARQAAALRGESAPSAAPRTATDAAEFLMQAWLERASVAIATAPAPDSLAGLQRRMSTRLDLAEGPLQEFVARQLGILDLLTYVTTAEQPALRDPALAALRAAAQRRERVAGVLEQAVELQRAIAAMWKLRMGVEPGAEEPAGDEEENP